MIPNPGQTLTDLALRLATRTAPALENAFDQADAGLITALLLSLSQDFERAIDNRMQDIHAMGDLFAEHADEAPGDVARRAFATRTPASYHLNDVTQLHAEGFELLITLHAWAEQNDDALNLQIWQLLRAHSERNKFELPLP